MAALPRPLSNENFPGPFRPFPIPKPLAEPSSMVHIAQADGRRPNARMTPLGVDDLTRMLVSVYLVRTDLWDRNRPSLSLSCLSTHHCVDPGARWPEAVFPYPYHVSLSDQVLNRHHLFGSFALSIQSLFHPASEYWCEPRSVKLHVVGIADMCAWTLSYDGARSPAGE